MFKKLGILLGALIVSSSVMFAGMLDVFKNYNYITAEETAQLIRKNPDNVVLVDIQEKPGFEKEHLKGAKATYAYPVKKQAELDRLAALLPNIKPDQKVVVICPRGGGGADRAYDFYLKNGIKKEQLYTLKNGQEGWPRDEIRDVLEK